MTIPERCLCDICKEEAIYKNFLVPVLADCDWTEGRPSVLSIEFMKIDICGKCMLRITKLKADFKGSNLRIIEDKYE